MKNVFKRLEGRRRTINSYSFPFSKRTMLFLEIDRNWRVITSCARDEKQEREMAL